VLEFSLSFGPLNIHFALASRELAEAGEYVDLASDTELVPADDDQGDDHEDDSDRIGFRAPRNA
jgi:hypothetical protein